MAISDCLSSVCGANDRQSGREIVSYMSQRDYCVPTSNVRQFSAVTAVHQLTTKASVIITTVHRVIYTYQLTSIGPTYSQYVLTDYLSAV